MNNDQLTEALNEAESLQHQFANLFCPLQVAPLDIPGDFLDPATPAPIEAAIEIRHPPTQPSLF